MFGTCDTLRSRARIAGDPDSPSTVVVIPVHDECRNLRRLLPSLREQGLSILAVEDASTDGSVELLDREASRDPRVSVIHRPALLGLGTAYVEGFETAIALGFKAVLQMDADLSHDPAEIPSLLDALEDADLVLGSRYVDGGSTPGWSLQRRILSRFGGAYTRAWTGLPYSDPTGGFRAFRASTLRSLDLAAIRSRGFAFQVEVLARAHARGLRIREVPITFRERLHGTSKLSSRILLEALASVPRLRRLVRSERRREAGAKGGLFPLPRH